jgi:class 3 adenylate cyclase
MEITILLFTTGEKILKTSIHVLLVEDSEDDALLIIRTLQAGDFQVSHERVDTVEALMSALDQGGWDIVISDYNMPALNGLIALEIVLKRGLDTPFILMSGSVGEEKAVEAMKAGAHDYIMKHNPMRLASAIRRELREVEIRKSRRQTDLDFKKSEESLNRLKRFFSPQVAELALSSELKDPFQWHRKDVTVLFVDLHGFTNFVETSEPEVVIDILQEYYSEVGKVVQKYAATVGHVAGDGIMIFLNDPIEVPNPQEKGVLIALEIRDLLGAVTKRWEQLEYPLNFGAGVASGFATVGGVGVEGCWDYSIFGTVTNTASRLCSQSNHGQILVSQRFFSAVSDLFEAEDVGQLMLKGLNRPLSTYNILRRKPK